MPLRSLVRWRLRADRVRARGRAPALAGLVGLLAIATSCRGGAGSGTSGDGGGDDGTPLATTGSSSGGTTTYDAPQGCSAEQPCEAGHCVAPYDPGSGRGDALCVPDCVPADAADRWCFDDAACCAELTCDPVDGLCRGPLVGSSTGDSWGASSSGSDGGSTAGSSSSSTGGSTGTGA